MTDNIKRSHRRMCVGGVRGRGVCVGLCVCGSTHVYISHGGVTLTEEYSNVRHKCI